MRNRSAAARADIDLAAATRDMQRTHALHLRRVPDLEERLLADMSHRLAVQHVALATGVHVAVLLHIHGPAPQVVAGRLSFVRRMGPIPTHQGGLVFLYSQLVPAWHS